MERVKTQDLRKQNKVARSLVERSAFMKTLLKVVGVLGVSLVMSGKLSMMNPKKSRQGSANCCFRWCPHPCSIRTRCHTRVLETTSKPSSILLTLCSSLNIVDATITTPTIVGVSCAILIVLFLIQPLGTSKIGSMFAPIVIIWLVFNLSFGVYVWRKHHPLCALHRLILGIESRSP